MCILSYYEPFANCSIFDSQVPVATYTQPGGLYFCVWLYNYTFCEPKKHTQKKKQTHTKKKQNNNKKNKDVLAGRIPVVQATVTQSGCIQTIICVQILQI